MRIEIRGTLGAQASEDIQLSVGLVFVTVQTRFEGADAGAEFTGYFTNSSDSKEQENDDENDGEFCGA